MSVSRSDSPEGRPSGLDGAGCFLGAIPADSTPGRAGAISEICAGSTRGQLERAGPAKNRAPRVSERAL